MSHPRKFYLKSLGAILALNAALIAPPAHSIGLCPTPVGPIGLIPCDSACGGSAMLNWGGDFAKGKADQLKTTTDFIAGEVKSMGNTASATAQLAAAIVEQTATQISEQSMQGIQSRTSLDAVASSIGAELNVLSRQRQGMVDSEMRVYQQLASQVVDVMGRSLILDDLSMDAQPSSGGIMAEVHGVNDDARNVTYMSQYIDGAEYIAAARAGAQEMRTIQQSNAEAASELRSQALAGGLSYLLRKTTESDDAVRGTGFEVHFSNPLDLARTTVFNPEELAISANSYSVIHRDPSTSRAESRSLAGLIASFQEEALARRSARHSAEMFGAALNVPYIMSDDGVAFTSSEGISRGMNRGRAYSPFWYLETRRANASGLYREMALMGAQRNALRYDMTQKLRERNLLMAGLAAQLVKGGQSE